MSNEAVAKPKNKFFLSPKEGAQFTVGVVVAMGLSNEIGEKGTMPWYLPEDLKHFREETSESCVIMGRRTFESIGKPLPKRRNIVISRDPSMEIKSVEGIELANSLEAALELAKSSPLASYRLKSQEFAAAKGLNFVELSYERIFIIGGANLFKSALDFANNLVLTKINANFPDADTFFPQFDEANWQLVKAVPPLNEACYKTSGAQPAEFRREIKDCSNELGYRFEWYYRK